MKFSQRMGITPIEKAIQREAIDQGLRNVLWSVLKTTVWDEWDAEPDHYSMRSRNPKARQVEIVVDQLWVHWFEEALDRVPRFDPGISTSAYNVLREVFMVGHWWEVYDLLEEIVQRLPEDWGRQIIPHLNNMLEMHCAAYRFVGYEITEITAESEIKAIEAGLAAPVPDAVTHLNQALALLSDRQNPDYRNSAKEAISAVESACQAVAGSPGAKLGDCLRVIKGKRPIHPAFEGALIKLYGYASDEGGIRHALNDAAGAVDYEDAKFMLVTCSAFVSFITAVRAK